MLAITARVIDDREGHIYDLVGRSCGTLQQDTDTATEEELSLREACNKIIHAKKIRADVAENDKSQQYLKPYIHLFGVHKKVPWKATLDVIAFAKEYASCVSHF